MSSFFLAGALEQVKSSPTMKLHELIDWRAIDAKLVGLYKREASKGGGPIPYAPCRCSSSCCWGNGITCRTRRSSRR